MCLVFCKIREHIEENNKLYGTKELKFDHSKAPKRGRLEDIQDFTHKKMYLKYYENPEDPQSDTV